MSEINPIPYTERPDVPDDLPEGRSANTYVPSSYQRRIREARAIHTGSPETYLTSEQEHALAADIQAGLAAQITLQGVERQMDTAPAEQFASLRQQCLDAEKVIQKGEQAERRLIECNLEFSSYLARASMNILPKGDSEAAEDTKAGRRHRALFNTDNDRRWLPKDITSLKSRHAILDDRIQVANIGLIKAARQFIPGKRNKEGELTGFLSFARAVISTSLAKYSLGEPRDMEKPIHIPRHIAEGILRARQSDWQHYFTPEQREELLSYDRLRDTDTLDELYFTGAAEEEIEREGDDPPLLWAGEIIPSDMEEDDSFKQVLENQRTDAIEEALSSLSERERQIIRLRHGDHKHTLSEIGEVVGLSREQVRQLEIRAMGRLRRMSNGLLAPYREITGDGIHPLRSGDIIKTQHSIGQASVRLLITPTPAAAATPPKDRMEAWQAYPGEQWDEPVRKTPEQLAAEYDKTGKRLKELIFGASLYTFQRSFAEDTRSPYPKALTERITKTLGRELTPFHVGDFWNKHLEAFLKHLTEKLEEDASPDRAIQLLSRLLAESMNDSDIVKLRIPNNLQGQLNYVGAWLPHGTLRVTGNVGNEAGHGMSSLGHLQIDGDAGDFAGARMQGNARLDIDGNAGNFLGFGMTGKASILVNGDAGSYCGHRMRAGATIEVIGSTGSEPGYQAIGSITVHGK